MKSEKRVFKKVLIFFLILLGSGLAVGTAPVKAQSSVVVVRSSGPTDKRINMVFLSEGYKDNQKLIFLSHAYQLMNKIFGQSPFSQYLSYFNVYSIWIPSNEEGSDHPFSGIYRDTYFNSSYDSYNTPRLITIPPNDFDISYANGVGKMQALLATYVPDYDIAILVVNDPEYGGSGGSFAISSVHQDASEIVIHELGHTHANLGDEYSTPYPGFPDIEEPNTTQETVRELIKWYPWIEATIPIPTPPITENALLIGLFEGAHYHLTDWYRPKLNCKMRSLGKPFCEVCAEQLIIANYRYISPIDTTNPPEASFELAGDELQEFTVVPIVPNSHDLNIQWYINDYPMTGETNDYYQMTGVQLGDGDHEVTVRVFDSTSLVRNDPALFTEESHSWYISVSGVGCCRNIRGNVNNDPEDKINIADLSYLVDYLFGIPTGPEPDCPEEANVNADEDSRINIADLTYLVSYLFGEPVGPAPLFCPDTLGN